ncbi:MAG: cytochrome c [Bacteroidota bacterium]
MQKLKIQKLVAAALITLFANACSSHSKDVISPTNNSPCDVSNVTYSMNVLPIISNNCYSCHGNGNTSGGIILEGYDNIKIQADNGNLKGVITHAPGYPAMPMDKPMLSDCDINTITAWINDGAPNN